MGHDITAIYSPRLASVVIMRTDGEHLIIPEALALPLADALRGAFAAPAVAAEILQPLETAWSAR